MNTMDRGQPSKSHCGNRIFSPTRLKANEISMPKSNENADCFVPGRFLQQKIFLERPDLLSGIKKIAVQTATSAGRHKHTEKEKRQCSEINQRPVSIHVTLILSMQRKMAIGFSTQADNRFLRFEPGNHEQGKIRGGFGMVLT